jgi:hypothetical protein
MVLNMRLVLFHAAMAILRGATLCSSQSVGDVEGVNWLALVDDEPNAIEYDLAPEGDLLDELNYLAANLCDLGSRITSQLLGILLTYHEHPRRDRIFHARCGG